MTEALPILVESSLQIAWDFLDGMGCIGDPQETTEFLLRSIIAQIERGERRPLALSNRAIGGYQRKPGSANAGALNEGPDVIQVLREDVRRED